MKNKKLQYKSIEAIILVMGRTTGIEPAHVGATNQCVNHFTTYAIFQAIMIILEDVWFVKYKIKKGI